MFRWLKDRGRKGRKPSTDSKLSLEGVRSKEDDYGFKQKQQLQGGGGGGGEYKRDLPPTPADLMTSCSVTDDDKSFHIYEEIPDLPFRCTPEGELRFTLAKEEASRRRRGSSRAGSPHSAASLPGSQGPRNISPYMVVPLERLGGTPSEFRGHNDSSEFRGHNDSSEFRGHNDSTEFRGHNDSSEFRAHNDSSEFRARTDASEFRGHNDSSEIRGSRDGSSFACALVGRKMPDGYPESGAVTAASPGCESASQGTSTPSCCGSSVFGSPLEVAGRCGCAGGDGVDMSDRLLSAINLTRLLAAVRLSSSSADTCTTSPICIGVDKDGRNISVSVSVTPTTPTNNNNNLNHNEDNNGDDDDQKTAGEIASSKTETGSADPQDHFVSEAETGSTSTREPGSNSSSSPPETGSTSTHGAKTGFVAKSEAGLTPINNNSNNSGNSNKGQSGMSSVQPTQTGLRFLPSPLEQTALSEILQLRPGESTELDPATIDAIILRLCSHTLQVEGQGQGQDDGRSSSSAATAAGLAKPLSSSALQRQELEDVERMLKEMVRAGEDDVVVSGGAGGVRGRASAKHHHHNHRHKQSPAARRAENSDTGFEYDVSTSSESDHTNYDYFLSKVARTRSLECEVKKMLRNSDSSRCESDYDDDDDEEEEEEEEEEREEKEEGVSGARESVSSSSTTTGSSTISQTSQTRRKRERLTPEVDAATDSDDGTMADLSESENSSGYYESAPGKPVEPLPATSAASASAAARAKSRSGKSASGGKKKAGRGEETGGDVQVQCYELDCSGGEAERGDFFPATGAGYSSSSGSIATATAAAAAGAPACSPSQSRRATAAAPDCLSGVTAEGSSSRPPHHPKTGRGRCSGGCKKPHHKHQHNHHHHHHHHHHRSSSDVNGERERKRGESGKSAKKPSGVGGEDGSGGGSSLDASGSSHARSLSLCDRGAGTRTRDCRRGSADAVGADSPNLSRPKSDKDDSNNKKGSNTNSKRSKDATYAKTALKPTDYPYSLLYPTPTPASTPSSNGANHSRSHPKTAKGSKKAAALGNAGLERAASFHSEQSPAESVYESRRQASEVYSIPAALPDPSPTPGGGGGGVRGLKGSASVPSKLSVARQVPESSEVYGTRAGLRRCSNRLLSDLIMLNYNRQVLNM